MIGKIHCCNSSLLFPHLGQLSSTQKRPNFLVSGSLCHNRPSTKVASKSEAALPREPFSLLPPELFQFGSRKGSVFDVPQLNKRVVKNRRSVTYSQPINNGQYFWFRRVVVVHRLDYTFWLNSTATTKVLKLFKKVCIYLETGCLGQSVLHV